MKDIILEYIIEQFGDDIPKETRTKHYSYCDFPEGECSCKDLNEINYDTSLITGGYIDSFSMVAVWHWLEITFNVKIPEREATPANFNSVDAMVDLVTKFKK